MTTTILALRLRACALLAPLLLPLPDGVAGLLAEGRYAEAVAAAASPVDLLEAARTLDARAVDRVALEVVRLAGPFDDPLETAAWLVRLSEATGGNAEALSCAGYLRIGADRPEEALAPLRRSLELRPGATRTLGYLGTALRRAGRFREAADVLLEALRSPGAPESFLRESLRACAAGLRRAGDLSYVDVLDAAGYRRQALAWALEDHDYRRGDRAALERVVRALCEAGTGPDTPADTLWRAARVLGFDGADGFRLLKAAVVKGEDPFREANHACPGAVLDLARACLARDRPVAAAALARKRLRIGECPAAWEVLESVPPHLAR